MSAPTSGAVGCRPFDLNHRGTEVTEPVIGAAIEVHRHLGHGLLESIYEAALAYEVAQRGLHVERQKVGPLSYKGLLFEEGFRIDFAAVRKLISVPSVSLWFH